MGARTRAAEQRVEDQRRHIGAMIDELETRLRTDVEHVRSGVTDRVDAIGDRLTHSGDAIPGADAVRAQVNDHPMTSMVGGFGAGIALGILSVGLPGDDGSEDAPRRDRRSEPRHRASGGGMAARLVDMLTGPMVMSTIGNPLQDEVRSLVKEVVGGFLGNAQARPRAAASGHEAHDAGSSTRASRTPSGLDGSATGAAPSANDRRRAG